jgi:hypothetical protein
MSVFFSEGILGISLSIWPHRSHVLHVISFSVIFNSNLDDGGYERAILSNWEVNRASRKFGGDTEKWVIVEGGKV